MPASPDTPRSPLDSFLTAFQADIDADAVRPLGEYLARFPGDDAAIGREYRATIRRASPAAPGSLGDAAGDRIAHYKVLREIGRGGQGIVYLAYDTRIHRRVALKVLQGLASVSADSLARFRREAAAASRLDHTGICAVYEAAVDGQVPYIAMRYVEGESIAAKISASRRTATTSDETTCVQISAIQGTAPPAATRETAPSSTSSHPASRAEIVQVVHLIEKVARALHAAHEAGVIHRDMKPGNVMITPEGEAVIMDFGLAHLEDEQLPTLTRTGDFFGTPAYMSPEQLMAQRVRLDRRTDVYSLGVTLFECLTLRRPFEAPTREGLYKEILVTEPPRARTLNPGVPADLEVVLQTALEKDRDHRYQTALELAEELRRVRSFEPILAKPVGPLVRIGRWAQRNPALAAAVGSLFAVLGVGLMVAIFLLGRVTSERDAKNAALDEKSGALAEKSAALSDYDRLGDLSRLQALEARAEDLWPCEPSKIADMRVWVDQGADLEQRLSGHLEALTRMRQRGRASPAESRATESRGPAPSWVFETTSEQFKYDTTARLVADLAAFCDPDPRKGVLADVRRRLRFAESVERETIGKYETRWADATRSIADVSECPKYHGLRIRPQLGLIPIGRDPASRLWEFVHLQTVAPGAEPVPTRGQDGRLVVTEDTGLVFVLLPGGTFRMGAVKEPSDEDASVIAPNVDSEARDNEGPVTEVTLEPFFLSKYELTQAIWLRLVGRNPSQYRPGAVFGETTVDLRSPVEQVSWEDCNSWLGRLGLVLPTEAQWECGARGGTTTPRWTDVGTDGLARAANLADQFCEENGGPQNWRYESWNDGYTVHAPAGTFEPNPFGLHDVLGNVWEWCRDCSGGYHVEPRAGDGLRTPPDSRARAYRGGSWLNIALDARSAYRGRGAPGLRDGDLGVRPARECRRD